MFDNFWYLILQNRKFIYPKQHIMKPDYQTFHPDGFSTVNPYIFSAEPEEHISFLKEAFDAQELGRTVNPKNGEIANCILKLGSSCIMISQARGAFEGMRTSFYLFVENVDEVYAHALKCGATDALAPADMDYQDRQAGIIDPGGNYWWISKRLVKKNYDD